MLVLTLGICKRSFMAKKILRYRKFTEYQKMTMHKLYFSGESLREISKKFKCPYRTLCRFKADWDAERTESIKFLCEKDFAREALPNYIDLVTAFPRIEDQLALLIRQLVVLGNSMTNEILHNLVFETSSSYRWSKRLRDIAKVVEKATELQIQAKGADIKITPDQLQQAIELIYKYKRKAKVS